MALKLAPEDQAEMVFSAHKMVNNAGIMHANEQTMFRNEYNGTELA